MNVLQKFLHEIGNYPLLTAEEEVEYAKQYRESEDPEVQEFAREQLINSNLRLVVKIAKNFHNNHLELMDLINEGILGLMTAVDKFDPTRGFRFSTCATPWIQASVRKAIMDKGRMIRKPAHIHQLLIKYNQTVEMLNHKGVDFNESDIAYAMGITEDKVKEIQVWRQSTVSLSTPLGDENEDTLEDLQADLHSEGPQAYVERKERENRIQNAIKKLKPKTQIIVKMRFGLGKDGDPEEFQTKHTLEEIGDYLHLTRERVRQIEKEALADLRTKLSDNK